MHTHTADDLLEALRSYDNHFRPPLRAHARLYGGYSASNYRVEDQRGRVFALKLCHGYSAAEVEAQCVCMAHVFRNVLARGGGIGCGALPTAEGNGYCAPAADGTPCCLLTWVEGRPADKVIADCGVPAADGKVTPVAATTVLHAIGDALARIHAAGPGRPRRGSPASSSARTRRAAHAT